MRTWRIPGALPGILFFWAWVASAATGELATDLFAEGDWVGCRRECERQLAETPRNETAQLLGAVCWLRLTNHSASTLSAIDSLSRLATNVDVRAMAAYELGRCCWMEGDPTNAFAFLRQSFVGTTSQPLFLRAGCSLDLLVRDFPTLGKDDPVFFQSLDTSRVLWTPEVVRECLPVHGQSEGLLSKPGQWVVAFYREMIRPAIGGRCSLDPSCSEYFKQASEKHGLLALPIQADRFIREPSAVQAAEHPVRVNGSTRYADPLSEHDGWLKGNNE